MSVAVADFVHFPLRRADAVLQDAVADDDFAVVAQDAVHLGRVEEVGEEDVGDRDENESDEDFADQPVGPQTERRRDDFARERRRLVRERLRFAGEALRAESLLFLLHRGKNCPLQGANLTLIV